MLRFKLKNNNNNNFFKYSTSWLFNYFLILFCWVYVTIYFFLHTANRLTSSISSLEKCFWNINAYELSNYISRSRKSSWFYWTVTCEMWKMKVSRYYFYICDSVLKVVGIRHTPKMRGRDKLSHHQAISWRTLCKSVFKLLVKSLDYFYFLYLYFWIM